MKLCEDVIKNSVLTNHPHFHNQLYGGTDPYGLVGGFITEALNTNQWVYKYFNVRQREREIEREEGGEKEFETERDMQRDVERGRKRYRKRKRDGEEIKKCSNVKKREKKWGDGRYKRT